MFPVSLGALPWRYRPPPSATAKPAVAAAVAPFAPEGWAAPAPLMSLGMALITVQFSGSLLLLYELPRAAKMGLAGAVALAAVLWILGVGLAGARAPRPAQEG